MELAIVVVVVEVTADKPTKDHAPSEGGMVGRLSRAGQRLLTVVN